MGQIGEELKKARELRGFSLHDVEDATKIRVKYLAALESEDFNIIPGRVYAIGFLKTYAKFLGIDDREIVAQYKEIAETQIPVEESVESPSKPQVKPTKLLLFFIFGAIALLVIITVFRFTNATEKVRVNPNSGEKHQTQVPNQDKPKEDTKSNKEINIPGENQKNNLSLTVSIKKDRCWIDVNIDGKQDFQGILMVDQSRTFIGNNKIIVKYGNAGVVEETFNGKTSYPVSTEKHVITKEYTLED